jgi:hypothetical protein
MDQEYRQSDIENRKLSARPTAAQPRTATLFGQATFVPAEPSAEDSYATIQIQLRESKEQKHEESS